MTAAPTKPTMSHTTYPVPVESIRERTQQMLARIESESRPGVWITRLSHEQVMQQVERVIEHATTGEPLPLQGMLFAVKDNIDVAGVPTTAGCPEFAYVPEHSATVVRRLCDAGAIVVGKTNLDQFATGLVGTRSPYGVVHNPHNPAYISGGSSSGSAVATALGLVDFSLGTDTAGSGRVPAAFCGLVGHKPSRGLLSTTGVVKACRSLDCVSILARSSSQAADIFAVARGFDPEDPYSRRESDLEQSPDCDPDLGFRFGVPAERDMEFFGNDDARQRFRRAVEKTIALGGTPVVIDFTPFRDAAKLLYEGPWVAERYAAIKSFIESTPEALLPITREIIEPAAKLSAVAAFEGLYKLLTLRRATEWQWTQMDVLLVPTTGTIYTIDEVQADPIRTNTNLGYYTNFVNLLDLSALAVPNYQYSNGLPSGVTFVAQAGCDAMLLKIGRRFEDAGGRGLTAPLPPAMGAGS